jgi:hypothetical protein
MSTLSVRHFTRCPYSRARQALEQALAAVADLGQPQTLTLSVPLGNDKTAGSLQKDVLVSYARSTDPKHFDQPWTVHWKPMPGGVYPEFDGELTVRAADTHSNCFLELDGSYTPPLGPIGAAFDAALGNRIATATGAQLLATIGDAMEREYQREEAAKRGES